MLVLSMVAFLSSLEWRPCTSPTDFWTVTISCSGRYNIIGIIEDRCHVEDKEATDQVLRMYMYNIGILA